MLLSAEDFVRFAIYSAVFLSFAALTVTGSEEPYFAKFYLINDTLYIGSNVYLLEL